MNSNKSHYIIIKQVIDSTAAVFLILLTLPIMLAAALAIKLTSKGPVIFKQDRPGKDEIIFRLYKFRTMRVQLDEHIGDERDAERLTKVGAILRKTSIDELPQLINIVKQDMSFIGPRPLLVRYLPFYSETEHTRHLVRPGISGWAQVNGRNRLSWEEKFQLDIEYVNHISFWFDLKIAFLTLKKLFYRSEVITAGTAGVSLALDRERMANQPGGGNQKG
jgi:lipopolysaccharide/colanic/teichoic acid biosynthesis glycosyltransferase